MKRPASRDEPPTTNRQEAVPALEARGIVKQFGAVKALNGVDLSLMPGEVHALLGENGAGKSTLMNVLFGLVSPDRGVLRRSGQPIQFRSPRDAMAAMIGMVHQHFALVPTFTVAENLFLGQAGFRYRPKQAAQRVEELCESVGLRIDPNQCVGELGVGEQQRVEILKALSRNAEVLILDEPTGVLAPLEVDELLALVRRLADRGTAVVFITHKLAEVERIADRITVLRRGERVLTGPAKAYSPEELARAMVGESVHSLDSPSSDRRNDAIPVLLSLNDVSVRGERGLRVKSVSFELRVGEVLGVAGVEGSGQAELAEAITGLRDAASGSIVVYGEDGEPFSLSDGVPAAYIAAGGAHIPEDRRKTGLILNMPIWENLILESHRRPPVRKGFFLNRRLACDEGHQSVHEYEIRAPSAMIKASALSGGNQQKVVIAREMTRQPRLLVAVNPTRGLDIRATAYVHEKIREHRETGGATLLVSSELDEIFSLSDRIAVMHGGEIAGILPASATREEVGILMTRGREATSGAAA